MGNTARSDADGRLLKFSVGVDLTEDKLSEDIDYNRSVISLVSKISADHTSVGLPGTYAKMSRAVLKRTIEELESKATDEEILLLLKKGIKIETESSKKHRIPRCKSCNHKLKEEK